MQMNQATRPDGRTAAGTGTANPYLFLVGSPRSGTTLLKRMLDAHPLLAMTRETHWITRYYKRRIGLTHDHRTTPALIPDLFDYHRFEHLGFRQQELEERFAAEPSVSYAEFVSALFDFYGERRGKPLVGDKTPGYVRNIPLLHRLWPQARFIHIIRDGRDVCLSMRNWRLSERTLGKFSTWGDDPVSTIALWWKRHVQLGIEAGRALPPGLYMETRYERLIEEPEQSCIELCRFLGLDYDKGMLEFSDGKTRTDTGLSANGAWLPPTRGLRDWRMQMSAMDAERFEAVAGDVLERLGYERHHPKPGPGVSRHADLIHRRFTGEVARPGVKMPQHW